MSRPLPTNVYVDGFNLYYGAVKGTRFKWLDIAAVIRDVFPNNPVHRIRYFTAKVSGRPQDPQKPQAPPHHPHIPKVCACHPPPRICLQLLISSHRPCQPHRFRPRRRLFRIGNGRSH